MTLRVNFDDLENKGTDSGGDIIYYYNGSPFTGIIEEYIHGVLVGESEFTAGHRGGGQRDYYPNGQLAEEYYIHFNKLEGSYKRWDESGSLISQSTYLQGNKIS